MKSAGRSRGAQQSPQWQRHLPKDEADTLGGYLYSRLGHVPAAGESVRWDSLELIVEQVNARRIRKVRARWLLPDAEHREDIGNVDR